MTLLEFIFRGPGHFFGTLLLLIVVGAIFVDIIHAVFYGPSSRQESSPVMDDDS